MLRSGTNDSNWVFPVEEDIHEVEQDQITASQINVIYHHSETRIHCSTDKVTINYINDELKKHKE